MYVYAATTFSGYIRPVFLYIAVCSRGDIRLVDGADERQGRVEVCNDNAWGTVCDDAFGAADATIVCRQLGFNTIGKKYWKLENYIRTK